MIASRSQTQNGNSGCHEAGDLGSGGGAMTYVRLTDLDLEDGVTEATLRPQPSRQSDDR